jgi:hypothetical protein
VRATLGFLELSGNKIVLQPAAFQTTRGSITNGEFNGRNKTRLLLRVCCTTEAEIGTTTIANVAAVNKSALRKSWVKPADVSQQAVSSGTGTRQRFRLNM